ncbi:MAG: endonuclease/exonuclease/phosphatase family protein, partial [Ignavibacteria bacterium]|nr:endonuclease/exonuclease/phosphatase family protein [Ignavibacteria bacterium]
VLLAVYAFPQSKKAESDTIAIAFWNVENFYDTLDDQNKKDDDFLPNGSYQWTKERFDKKMEHLGQAIKDMNDKKGPDMIGMAEVENRWVLEQLIKTNLSGLDFSIAHIDSPDERGIDAALLYNSKKFELVSLRGDTVSLADKYPTRLILHAELKTIFGDIVHVFVNHWPSRRNGQDKSEINRVTAATVLKGEVDKLLAANKNARIVIMGDFNDEPDNNSILKTLDAGLYTCDSVKQNTTLHNVSWERKGKGEGTLKYRDTWNCLDQIIISPDVLTDAQFKYICGSYTIFRPDYLIQHGGKYDGSPFPTYGGTRYLGGYSDHLPVFAKFIVKAR